MPRIRTIKPKFWDDAKLGKISRDARLLFIGVWNFSDDLGVFIADHVWIKSKVFPYDQIDSLLLEKWIQELVKWKFIEPICHKEEQFYHIRTFKTHQRIDKPNNDDIFIPKDLLTNILQQYRNNLGTIPEQSNTIPESIPCGKEGKGREGKGVVEEEIPPPPKQDFSEMTQSDLVSFQAKLIQETVFIEQLMMTKGIKTKTDMLGWIKYFNLHIIGEEKLNKDYPEYKRHFKNWVVKMDTNKPPPINGNSINVPVEKKSVDEMMAKYR